MMRCVYCGEPAPEPGRACCGEVHFEDDTDPRSCFNDPQDVMYLPPEERE